jgi:cytochrome c peroxidase
MHDGVFKTLEEVVAFYSRGGGDDPRKTPLLKPLALTVAEQQDLVAFLRSLSSDRPILVERPDLPDYVPVMK